MSTIVTRAGKGSALTHTEVDANFTNLNTDKLQSGSTAAALTITSATINGGAINSTTVGATTPAAGTFTSLSDSGNLAFTGTGNRITGDFSNATLANRVTFQSSTTNGTTALQVIPNGTSTQTQYSLYSDSSITNGNYGDLTLNNNEFRFRTNALGTGTAVPMTFYTGGSERMRVDTSGNVGIGTSSPGNKLHVNGDLRTQGNFFLANTTGQRIYPYYASATNHNYVGAESDGSLTFGTGTSSPTERARIDSSGNLLVGTTTSNGLITAQFNGLTQIGMTFNDTSNSGTTQAVVFRKNTATQVGSIQTSTTATSYVTSSDYRLKENIAPMTGALAKVAALKPCTYTWKSDGTSGQGFIAHELQAVVPDAVTGEKDAVNEDGSIKPQGIDTSFLVATLTAAIQEQQQMIETLQAKVAALENA